MIKERMCLYGFGVVGMACFNMEYSSNFLYK